METLTDWPVELGLPLSSGYSHSVPTAKATVMTAGVSRARRDIASPVSEFSVAFIWSDSQLHRYRQFAKQAIDGTTGWFVMRLWSGGSIEPHTVRIKSANKYQRQPPHWSVSFVLECPDRYQLPDDIGEVLLDWKLTDLMNAGEMAEKSLCVLGEIFQGSMSYQFRLALMANKSLLIEVINTARHHFLQINDDSIITVKVTLMMADPVVELATFTGPGIFPINLSLRQFELIANANTVVILSGN